MRKILILTLLILTTLCGFGTANSQEKTTPTALSTAAREARQEANALVRESREQFIARLIAEIGATRAVTDTQRARIAALEKEVIAADARGDSLSVSYAQAKTEIAELRLSLSENQHALSDKTLALAVARSDLERERGAKRMWRKRTFYAGVAVVALAGFLAVK